MTVSGNLTIREQKKGPVWYVKWRDATGHQYQKALGPAWLKRWRKPPPGHFTKKDADAALATILRCARESPDHWFDQQSQTHHLSFRDQALVWLAERRGGKIRSVQP